MRAPGLINFVLVTGTTACLMGVVAKQPVPLPAHEPGVLPARLVLPPDTPITDPELPYEFKDEADQNPLTKPKSKLYLEEPANISTKVEYDAKSGNYNVKQKMGERDYRRETYLTDKEYQDYVFRQEMRDYWRSRVAADDLNERPRQGLIPKLQVNSELFDRIFGGNTVDIKPTGTAELIFGLNRNKNLNPSIPQRQQKITNFDFNMRIQLNLIGKIGDKLKVTTNYNTEASFDWENQVKLDYTGYEDEIIKKIEAGNVTLPLNSSLISGSQTLFGLKTELQFGRLRATTVFSQQKGKKQEITVQGGAQTQQFVLSADNYEQNKHFFLGHYFRDRYDRWMATLPIVNTPIVITKIEVYLLGINGNAEQTRNIVAFEDLGEGDSLDIYSGLRSSVSPSQYNITDTDPLDSLAHNNANTLYSIMTGTAGGLLKNRNIDEVSNLLSSTREATNTTNPGDIYMDASRDYNIIRNARRLNPSEFSYNARLGYISLNQQLNNDQALAVSYQYTYGDQTYQVGEFSEQVPDNTKLLVAKLLKSTVVNVKQPMWDLMMKNVYALGAYNLNPEDFRLDVFYNNIETGVDVPYLPSGPVNGQQLIRVLGADKLSVNGDRQPDGFYDFINGYTISQNNGRAYFPTAEPFGSGLRRAFGESQEEADKYVFQELYDSTKTAASFVQNKNRFKIKGSYRSSSGSEIALNALNIPQGAVIVTANGVALQENVDFTVDYTLGRVKIINEGILNSGATVKVSLESNSLFSVQQKSLLGTRLDFKASRDLTLGGTFLRFSERPLTQKVTIGDEPVNNVVAGLDYNYKTDAPFLTRILDKLPLFSTKEMSSISTRGEIAKLFPGNAKAIRVNGGNSYIDDFEGSISLIDIRGANSWHLGSIPQNQPAFPEAVFSNTITTGLNRARFNWYNVDAMFTRDQGGTTPSYYTSQRLFSNNMWRQVFETELFPGKTPPNGQQVVLPLLDLAFFPSERGPYNYDVNGVPGKSAGINRDGSLKNPETRWGGIMRRLETNDFQAANVEYIQFWLMDPYNEDYNTETHPQFMADSLPRGELFINLGNISEDIVKDGRMVYENGLPGQSEFSGNLQVDANNVANVPVLPPVINAFSQDNNDRALQDVGYDGLTDDMERERFKEALDEIRNGDFTQEARDAFISDPSSDRYHFFRGDDLDNQQANTIQRYRGYNNPEGNSPTEAQYSNANPQGGNYSTAASNLPNIEDVNRDNTLSESENYYQYRISISPDDIQEAAIGRNFIVDAFDGTATFSGESKTVKWYQFKIPISQFEDNFGNMEGFNSIRFMRVYMKGFNRPVLLRLARFELVRSDWRRYQFDLKQPGENIAVDDNSTSFDVSAVSLLENGNKKPVNYVLPPDIEQQQNVQATNLVLQNEQSLQMRLCGLRDGDSRAIFKNVDLDTRMFENIKMDVHAESPSDFSVKDDDLHLFFRVGTDYNNNFYEYEVPLKMTPPGLYDGNSLSGREAVWPKANQVNLRFEDISVVKDERNRTVGYYSNLNELSTPYSKAFEGYTITIVGNPNLATIKSVMVGVRNPRSTDGRSHCAEVWINELRLTDFTNKGGWATTGQVQAKLADLGMVSLAGTYKSPYWGSVESKINERSRETNKNWDVSTSVNAGKFFPTDWKISLPVFYNYGQTIITPLFNPLDPDVKVSDLQKNPAISDALKDRVERQIQDFTERKGFNISNARIDGFKNPKAPPLPWDIGNFSTTFAYNEFSQRNVNIEYNIRRQYRGNLQYMYSLRSPPTFKPFSKTKALDNKWFALIKDMNLQLLPNSFGASFDVNRTYNAQKNRDITSFYGSSDFVNPTLVNKNFVMTRAYNLRWDLTKNLKYDFMASNEGRIMEPSGEYWNVDKPYRDYVINTFMNGRNTTLSNGEVDRIGKFGENTAYRQQMNLNADLPINKIPILDFVKTTYRFGGTYTWMRRPFAADDNIGHTIQNTSQHSVNGTLNMVQLYNKIPYFRKLNSPQRPNPRTQGGRNPAQPGKQKDSVEKTNNFKEAAEYAARFIMMFKNVSVNYQLTGGQALPNFKPSSQYVGMNFDEYKGAPGFLFTTGLYDPDIRQRSGENNWLARTSTLTTPYTETRNTTYSYRTNIEPHGSLRIELNGTYNKQRSLTEYILYNDSLDRFNYNVSPTETGNFNISTVTFLRAFRDGNDPVESKLFDEFLEDRFTMAKELGKRNEASEGEIVLQEEDNYIDGYSNNQQDVLMGAFYRTYTGREIKDYSTKNIFPRVPLPNWTVTWDGLGKLPFFKERFKNITVRHGYRSTYAISGFNNNLLFKGEEQTARMPVSLSTGTTALNSNFVPFYVINAVTISERFEPLIKFDIGFNQSQWSANVETRRDKTTSLNLTGFQIIETKGQEYIIGLGYMYPKLRFKNIHIQGKVLESDLRIKVDISFRKNISVMRQIETGISTPTGGSNILTMRSSADYQLTPSIMIRLFYDWIKNMPQTSATFPTSNINAGFSLRINFQ